MLLEEDIKKMIHELVHTDVAQIDLSGLTITIKVFDSGTKLFLSTPVYFGGNFIPKGVRGCIKHQAPFDNISIRTMLKIDEDNYSIILNYIDKIGAFNNNRFIDLLEDFSWLAGKWREYLDEHDKNDLVHIPN